MCVKAFAKAVNLAGSIDPEALVDALSTISVAAPQGMVQMNPVHHHARVNTYLTRCEADGTFAIVEKFGAIDPMLPERYKHQQVTQRANLGDDIRLQARMLEQMSDAVLLVNSHNGSILYTNAGAEKLFGYDKGEMLGLPIATINDPSYRDPLETADNILSILNKRGEWQGEIHNIKKNGTPVWCYAMVSIFTHPTLGEVWLSVHRDITERKQIERDLRIAATAFETQESLMITDNKLVIIRVNQAFTQDTGYTTEEIVGLKPKLLKSGRHDAAFYKAMWESINSTGKWQGEIWDKRKNGEIRPKWITISAVKDANGIVTHYVGLYMDITERKQIEKALKESKEIADSAVCRHNVD